MDQERVPGDAAASPETDDSGNPTAASPGEAPAATTDMPGPDASDADTSGSDSSSRASAGSSTGRFDPQQMVAQLQAMIDQVANNASPQLREIAAKAAELAAKAGERAGPLAQKAAVMTQSVGERVAARSSQVAADLRRAGGGDESSTAESSTGEPTVSDNPEEQPRGV